MEHSFKGVNIFSSRDASVRSMRGHAYIFQVRHMCNHQLAVFIASSMLRNDIIFTLVYTAHISIYIYFAFRQNPMKHTTTIPSPSHSISLFSSYNLVYSLILERELTRTRHRIPHISSWRTVENIFHRCSRRSCSHIASQFFFFFFFYLPHINPIGIFTIHFVIYWHLYGHHRWHWRIRVSI